MIEYLRNERAWKFDPLPVNLNSATLYCSMGTLSKTKKGDPVDMDAVLSVIKVLPACIARSMRDHHTEEDVNAFIDTIVLDFGNAESLAVIQHLQMIFMGIDPTKVVKKDPVPEA